MKKTIKKEKKSIQKKKSICPYCGSRDTQKINYVDSSLNNKRYSLYFCNSCNIQFYTPLKFENIYENEKNKDYSSLHKGRNDLPEWTIEIENTIKKLKIDVKGKKILDIGAGDCINYKMLKENFSISTKQYYAVELDKKSVACGRRRGVRNIICGYFDMHILKKINIKFDILIASEVMEHQIDPKRFIETCFRLLKRGGILIITVPNRDRFLLRQRSIPNDIPPHHFLRFDKTFFKKNFQDKIILVHDYNSRNKTIKTTSEFICEILLNNKYFWVLFVPITFILRILDSIRGEGIIVLIRG